MKLSSSLGSLLAVCGAFLPSAATAQVTPTEMESLFYVSISQTLAGATTPSANPDLDFTCGNGAIPVLLGDENFDWISPDDCSLISGSTLRCTDLTIKKRLLFGQEQIETGLVVACRGQSTASTDFDSLQVTLPESSFSKQTNALAASITRSLGVRRICDLPRFDLPYADGSPRSDIYFPVIFTDFYIECSTYQPATVGLMMGMGGRCETQMTSGCGGWGQSLCSESTILDEYTVTVGATPEGTGNAFSCLYSVDPEPVPSIPNGLYQAEYNVEFGASSALIAGPCSFEQGELSIQCEHGGAIAFDQQVSAGPTCEQVDTSTLVCDMTNVAEGAAYVACSGTSKERLAISAVWTPGDRNSLQCQDELSVMSRTLWIGQQCSLDVLAARPQQYLMSADDSAVSCYPFQSSHVDIIDAVYDIKDEDTGEVIESKRVIMPYEVCGLADAAVFAEDEAPMTKMMAKILPNHVVDDCVFVIADAAPTNGLAGGFEVVKQSHSNTASIMDLVKANNNNRAGSQGIGENSTQDGAMEAWIDLEREIVKTQNHEQQGNANATGGTYYSTDYFDGAEAFPFASGSSRAPMAWRSGSIAVASILCFLQAL